MYCMLSRDSVAYKGFMFTNLVPGLEVKYGKTVNNHLYHIGFTIKNKIMEGVVWLKKDEVHPWVRIFKTTHMS